MTPPATGRYLARGRLNRYPIDTLMTPLILLLAVGAFVLSWCTTWSMKRVAPRFGFVDKPGGHKAHHNPRPLLGGVGIFLGVALPMLAVLLAVAFGKPFIARLTGIDPAYLDGIARQTPLAAAFLIAMFAMHLLGLFDDHKPLGPYLKLFIQLLVVTLLVIEFRELRILTALGTIPSIIITVLWISAITNAFNFLDNMDGLSAGIAAVCTIAFLITALQIGQWFVAANLALLLGALLAFLCFNFPPASIFMGDCGSLVIGFVLGVLTVRTTFLNPTQTLAGGWYSLLAPVIVMAVPLYDLIVVSLIRLARGKSPFVGDNNHFSHRLVARGMSRRTAVLCLYLITAATAIAAILLPNVTSGFNAWLIFAQTLLILGVVALLEQHPLPITTSPSPSASSSSTTISSDAKP